MIWSARPWYCSSGSTSVSASSAGESPGSTSIPARHAQRGRAKPLAGSCRISAGEPPGSYDRVRWDLAGARLGREIGEGRTRTADRVLPSPSEKRCAFLARYSGFLGYLDFHLL